MKHIQNKGFTLVEIIVAIICSTFVVATIALTFRLIFNQYSEILLASEIQIEAQVLESELKNKIIGAESYEYNSAEKLLTIARTDGDVYFQFQDGKSYISNNKEGIVKTENFLSNYIEYIDIKPEKASSDTYEDLITIKLLEKASNVQYNKTLSFRFRQ